MYDVYVWWHDDDVYVWWHDMIPNKSIYQSNPLNFYETDVYTCTSISNAHMKEKP